MQSSPQLNRDHFYRAAPAPSVIARRSKEKLFAGYVFVCYIILIIFALAGFTSLLYGGTLLKLWQLWLRLHPRLDMWIAVTFFACIAITFVGIQTYKAFDSFWSIQSFSSLYRTCRYIDPLQLMQYRLWYAMATHPEKFSYAFSGQTILVQVGKKDQIDAPVSTGVLESEDFSFLENVDPPVDVPPLPSVEVMESSLPSNEMEESAITSSSPTTEDVNEMSPQRSQKHEAQLRPEESTVLEGREASSEVQQTQGISKEIQGQLRLIISLRETVKLFSIEKREDHSEELSREKRIPLALGNVTYQAIIAFLARDIKKLMNAESVMNDVYAHIEDKTKVQPLFNKHISRIRYQVRKGMRSAFPHLGPIIEKFDLFKNETDGPNSLWRLSDSCVVSGIDLLRSFYNEMYALTRMKRTHSNTASVQEKKLLNNAQRLIKYYSGDYLEKNRDDEEGYVGGYLFGHMNELPFREWAISFFKECRRKYIFCIEQVAMREDLLWQEVKQPENLENAIKFYKECAYAATCAPVDQKLGERSLRSCLLLYRKVPEETEAAETFYETYKRRIYRVAAEWNPEKETKVLLNDIGFLEE